MSTNNIQSWSLEPVICLDLPLDYEAVLSLPAPLFCPKKKFPAVSRNKDSKLRPNVDQMWAKCSPNMDHLAGWNSVELTGS